MADQADVEKAIVSLIDGILYPAGQSGDPPLTIAGAPCRIERGWPDQKKLDEDLRAGVFNVSVYPRPNMERNLTRYPQVRRQNPLPAPTYSLSANGQVVTVAGAAPSAYTPQNLALIVSGQPFVTTATAGETPAQVAVALAALLAAAFVGVSVSGAAITLPDAAVLQATRVGVTGSVTREVGRQEKYFQIIFWCPNPDIRDIVVGAVDAAMRLIDFMDLPDGSSARLLYKGSNQTDGPQKELLYRRELIYAVEFATTITEPATQIVVSEALFPEFELIDDAGNVVFGLDFSDPANSGFLPGI